LMIALGFPDNYNQFTLSDRLTDSGDTSTQFRSDMNVILNTNKSNPNFNVTFKDAFPVSLGAINLEVTSTSLEPIAVEASFAYSGSFSIEKIK